MNWYIGQRIVAIKNHRYGDFKIGDEFTIKGLKDSRCRCQEVEIDIGRVSFNDFASCPTCDGIWKKDSKICWYSELRFAPLDEWQQAEKAVKELLEPKEEVLGIIYGVPLGKTEP